MSRTPVSCLLTLLALAAAPAAWTGQVRVLINDLPGADPQVGRQILETCKNHQITALPLSPEDLDTARLSSPSPEDILILTECGTLPLDAAQPLEQYLSQGGRLMALGGTLFRNRIGRIGNDWVTEAGYQERWAGVPLEHSVCDLASLDSKAWKHASNDASHATSWVIEEDPKQGKCIHLSIKDLSGWDTLYPGGLRLPVPAGQKYTCFWAKGGPRTDRMLFEWEEADGSRWIAAVALTQDWKRYVLPLSAFRFWESVPARASSTLNLGNAARFNFGLAATHTPGLWGNHEIWIAGIGTCAGLGQTELDWDVHFKPHEMLYPSYHTYPCTDTGTLHLSKNTGLIPDNGRWRFTIPSAPGALHPRPQSTCIRRERTHRWIPLLDLDSPKGDFRGTAAALQFTQDMKQMWAAFAIEESAFYLQKPVQDFIAALAERMADPVFLWEGGTSRYTYFPDHSVSIGHRVIAPPTHREALSVEMLIRDESSGEVVWKDSGEPAFEDNYELLLDTVPFLAGRTYRVVVSLQCEGKEIDCLEHPLHIWSHDSSLAEIQIKKGDFVLDGRPWVPYGVNYMPSSGIARQENEPFEFWLGPRGYDTEIVERDLARIAGMGMNMVSVFLYHDSLSAMNLPDFLRLCEKHQLRVNLSLRPGTPLDFEWEKVQEMIETCRLASSRVLFAYDLAWEPHFEGAKDRSRYTREWNDWITKKHTSLEAAFKAWDYQEPVDAGLLPVPQSEQWYEAGPWDRLALDYGDFLNDLLDQHYRRARELVLSVDPHHAVSFRMQHAGDPTYRGPTWIPYDFRGVAGAVDVLEPEAYGRLGNWEQIKPGRFTVDYGRAVAPDLPVFWAEMGMPAWDMTSMSAPAASLEQVAEYYRLFHQMLLDSHSNGVAFWWYPGGFRVGENSDFGILNPDGTDRPVTRVIRDLGPSIRDQGPRPEPDTWIEIDLATRPGGLAGVYAAVKDEYWNAIEKKKTVGLRLKN
jgi:hypothetical protein